MRTLVKIGLVIPMVALLVFTVALAEETKDTTELDGLLNGSTLGGEKARTADAAGDDVQAISATREAFGERRNIASRRSGSTGRAGLSSANSNDRWWNRGSSGSGSSSGSDASGSGKSASDSSSEVSPDDFGDDSSSGKSGS